MHRVTFRLDWRSWFALLRGKPATVTLTFLQPARLHELVIVTLLPPWSSLVGAPAETEK